MRSSCAWGIIAAAGEKVFIAWDVGKKAVNVDEMEVWKWCEVHQRDVRLDGGKVMCLDECGRL